MKHYFESTRKMISLNPRIVLPAHGPPNFNPLPLLNTYLKHRQEREDNILQCYNSGHRSLDEIVRNVYSDVPEHMWPVAKSNIDLHLQKLEAEGKLSKL